MNKIYTVEEINFISAYCGSTKSETLESIFDALPQITDKDMKAIAESCVDILTQLSEEQFAECHFDEILTE